MKTKPKNYKPLLNTKEYRRAVRAGKQFAEMLSGDFGFECPNVNLTALMSMIAGWIMGQPYFAPWMAENLRRHPRNAIIDEVQDQAAQVASDAAGNHYRFKETNLNWRHMMPAEGTDWREQYAVLLRDYVSTRRQLNRVLGR